MLLCIHIFRACMHIDRDRITIANSQWIEFMCTSLFTNIIWFLFEFFSSSAPCSHTLSRSHLLAFCGFSPFLFIVFFFFNLSRAWFQFMIVTRRWSCFAAPPHSNFVVAIFIFWSYAHKKSSNLAASLFNDFHFFSFAIWNACTSSVWVAKTIYGVGWFGPQVNNLWATLSVLVVGNLVIRMVLPTMSHLSKWKWFGFAFG